MNLQTLDIAVVVIYAVFLVFIANFVSREKAGHEKDTSDYFLAGRSLPWWAIGASLIAANISAEQIIGMSGSAWVMGIAIGAYEWMAAITLVIVAKWLLPVFLKHKIYTMPQFLEQRYDHRVRTVMALFWLGIYVFVNLTSIMWLGALAVNTVTGVDLTVGLIALGGFAAAYSLYGGLKAVALTDIIQVTLLVLGGILVTQILRVGAELRSGYDAMREVFPLWATTPLVFAGATLLGYGAATAGGCTSGHGMCGTAQRSPASLAVTATFMTTAIVTTFALRVLTGGEL